MRPSDLWKTDDVQGGLDNAYNFRATQESERAAGTSEQVSFEWYTPFNQRISIPVFDAATIGAGRVSASEDHRRGSSMGIADPPKWSRSVIGLGGSSFQPSFSHVADNHATNQTPAQQGHQPSNALSTCAPMFNTVANQPSMTAGMPVHSDPKDSGAYCKSCQSKLNLDCEERGVKRPRR